MTILVVDDHAATRKVLRVLLETTGYTVVEAEDGEEALKAFASVSIDAMITDILMPKMDGYRLCHSLRSDPRYRQLPIIFHTATYTSADDERMSLQVGADRFLRKPAAASEVLGALSEVLARQSDAAPKISASPPGLELMQKYSQRLVEALEAKNLELERQKTALQASERLFRQLFESANDAMFLVRFAEPGKPGRFVDVNDVACHLLGFSREELLTRTTRDLDSLEEGKSFSDIAARLQSAKRIVFERVIVAKDGRRVPVEISARLFESGGEILGIAALRDITERKQGERLRSAVSVSLSHELNTPLHGILGMLQLLETSGERPDPAEMRDALGGIRDSAKRLQILVQRNLDFARLAALHAAPKPAAASANATRDLAPACQATAVEVARAHGRERDLQVELSPLFGSLSEHWLARLVTELLDNAFKFSLPGQPVRLRGGSVDRVMSLVIQDSGRGMRPEEVASLGAFVQFEREHFEQQGVGLGLYLARQIAELHGGTLQIETTHGEGTIVGVTLSKGEGGRAP